MTRDQTHRTAFALFLCITSTAVLVGQNSGPSPRSGPIPNKDSNGQPSAPIPQLQQHDTRYVIQRQDILQIFFALSSELNQTATVQPDGYINLEGSHSVYVEGLTVPKAVDAIKDAYKGILNNPIVQVDVKDFQRPLFTVNGQVVKPGQYELRAETTVSEAIAIAGGLQPSAKSQVFLLHRTSAAWMKVEKLDLKDMMNGKSMKEDALVQSGDMIIVPETFISKFRKYVPYSLNAGTYVQANPL